MRPYFGSLIEKLYSRKPESWLSIIIGLLNAFDYDDQTDLERRLQTLRHNVRKKWKVPGHKCAYIYRSLRKYECIYIFYVFPYEHYDQRHEVVHDLCSQELSKKGCRMCVYIGRMLSDWQEAYSFIGIARNAVID